MGSDWEVFPKCLEGVLEVFGQLSESVPGGLERVQKMLASVWKVFRNEQENVPEVFRKCSGSFPRSVGKVLGK